MSYQKVQNFKCRCPLIRINVFGIHESHQIPNIPCDRSSNDVFLNQHLQWYHNFDSGSARKLVRAIFNNTSPHQNLFSINEPIVKRNIAVEGYKCKCPLTHDGAFGLSDEHDITNVPCGRADKEVLCFQHLQYHHNLSSRAAKKIVLAILSYTPTVTQLFHNDDFVTQSKCAVRKLKAKCPLIATHMYGLGDQHRVPNIPCDRADQDIFLFHHLTYFHKLNPKAATQLIRAILLHKNPTEPIFHYNDTIVVSHHTLNDQETRRSKKIKNNQQTLSEFNYSNQFDSKSFESFQSNFVSNYPSFFNPLNTSALSALLHKNSSGKMENNSIPLDFTVNKQQTYQMSYSYPTNNMAHGHDLNSFLT
ncbi:unnamed protein product [Rotaria socialis]|uniref:Uncharacterized protein n=1 Tax=Rotaria socialis TaxID=392032 RepID=A0A817VEC5_9BILA|nr:unnamed protein product [Rotaria socialis]CAF3388171.1 unnamed protein product [Rotaria socialis]CAF3581017.1 unnamed protein product [Rotaria socialis]